jgi:hypothetical protein
MSLTARVGVALLACALAAGCDDAPAPKAAPTQGGASAKPASKEAQLPANMVAAVSAGKSAAMISVHFALVAVPTVGKPLPVDIAIVPHRPFTSVRAFFEAPDAVIMATGDVFAPQTDVKAETVIAHKVLLQPTQEGVFLVTAAVETEGEDGTVTRIYSIPVIVHPATETPAAPTVKPAANPDSNTPAG